MQHGRILYRVSKIKQIQKQLKKSNEPNNIRQSEKFKIFEKKNFPTEKFLMTPCRF